MRMCRQKFAPKCRGYHSTPVEYRSFSLRFPQIELNHCPATSTNYLVQQLLWQLYYTIQKITVLLLNFTGSVYPADNCVRWRTFRFRASSLSISSLHSRTVNSDLWIVETRTGSWVHTYPKLHFQGLSVSSERAPTNPKKKTGCDGPFSCWAPHPPGKQTRVHHEADVSFIPDIGGVG